MILVIGQFKLQSELYRTQYLRGVNYSKDIGVRAKSIFDGPKLRKIAVENADALIAVIGSDFSSPDKAIGTKVEIVNCRSRILMYLVRTSYGKFSILSEPPYVIGKLPTWEEYVRDAEREISEKLIGEPLKDKDWW